MIIYEAENKRLRLLNGKETDCNDVKRLGSTDCVSRYDSMTRCLMLFSHNNNSIVAVHKLSISFVSVKLFWIWFTIALNRCDERKKTTGCQVAGWTTTSIDTRFACCHHVKITMQITPITHLWIEWQEHRFYSLHSHALHLHFLWCRIFKGTHHREGGYNVR